MYVYSRGGEQRKKQNEDGKQRRTSGLTEPCANANGVFVQSLF